MASRFAIDDVESSNKCPVCHDTIKDPRVLTCQHKVCTQCLHQHVSASARADNTFHCPSCRHKFELPKEGVSGITKVPQSTKGRRTAAAQVRQSSVVSTVTCSKKGHGDRTVTAFCIDCHKFYCKDCLDNHELFDAMVGHRMTPFDQMSPADIKHAQSDSLKNTCSEHEQPLNIVCNACDKLICSTCYIFKHKDHPIQELIDAAREAQTKLERIAKETIDYITKQTIDMTQVGQTRKNIRANVKVSKEGVRKTARRIRDIIDHHERDLIQDLDRYEAEALAKLDKLEKDSEKKKAEASTFQQEVEDLRRSGKAIDQVVLAPDMQKQCDARKTLKKENLTWKFVFDNNKRTANSLKAMFGSVKLTTPVVTLGEHVQQVPLKYEGNKVVTGMVVIGDCMCVTHGKDPHLWLYDMTSSRYQECQVPGMLYPVGMALVDLADRTVVITDENKDGGKLHYVKISTDFSITYVKECTFPVPYPCRISVSRENGNLLIGQWGSEFAVCNAEGDVQRQVTVASHDSTERSPYCVTRTKDGYAIIMMETDENGIIQWVDKDGNCTHTYGCNDGQQLGRANHMVVDSDGRLIVAEHSNDRVHLVDYSDHLSQFLLTHEDGIDSPSCVYLDEAAEQLYVSHGRIESMEVRVYRWPPKPEDYQLEVNISQF